MKQPFFLPLTLFGILLAGFMILLRLHDSPQPVAAHSALGWGQHAAPELQYIHTGEMVQASSLHNSIQQKQLLVKASAATLLAQTSKTTCTLAYDKTAFPTEVSAGGVATITLNVAPTGVCSPTTSPVDVMLVIDRSGSMYGQKFEDTQNAAKAFIDAMNDQVDQVGLVSFSSTGRGTLDSQLSQDFASVKQAIDTLRVGGVTNIHEGLEIANAEMISDRHRSNSAAIVILLTDGYHGGVPPLSSLYQVANDMKTTGIQIISIGVGNSNHTQLQTIASSKNDHYYAPTSDNLAQIYTSLTNKVRWVARSMVIQDTLSPYVMLMSHSFQGPVVPNVNGNELVWNVGNINMGDKITLSYTVVMTDQAGTWDTNTLATGTYTNTNGTSDTITFPVPTVHVKQDCGQPELKNISPMWTCGITHTRTITDTDPLTNTQTQTAINSEPITHTQYITLTGGGFFTQSITATIGTIPVSLTHVSAREIVATYADKLPAGTYNVSVVNQCDAGDYSSTLSDAWRVYPAPNVVDIRPVEGYSDIPSEITICGDGFSAPGTEVVIDLPSGEMLLESQATYGDDCMVGTVPADIPAGDYAIIVRSPCGESTGTYRVLSTYLNNDLWGQHIWVKDADGASVSVREPGITIGAIVNRRGGKAPLQNVTVRFYEGNPEQPDALEIGDGTIVLMPPRVTPTERIAGYSTSEVIWTPSRGEGTYTLYAVIDPDDAEQEDVEENNILSKEVVVLPSADMLGVDTTAPVVDGVHINQGLGFDTIYDSNISVQVSTSDSQHSRRFNHEKLLFVELVYNAAMGAWVPVKSSKWVDTTTHFTTTLELFPRGGLHYLQTWASDRDGNISRKPYQRQLNLVQQCTPLQRNGTDVYREHLNAGQEVYVEVVPCTGDPDLYVWAPNWQENAQSGASGAYASNQETGATEMISFTAPISGIYSIEVYGYTPSEYTIQIDSTPVSNTLSLQTNNIEYDNGYKTAGTSQLKTQPSNPSLPADSEPPTNMGVEPVPFESLPSRPFWLFLTTLLAQR